MPCHGSIVTKVQNAAAFRRETKVWIGRLLTFTYTWRLRLRWPEHGRLAIGIIGPCQVIGSPLNKQRSTRADGAH